jgi:hypothetical protein
LCFAQDHLAADALSFFSGPSGDLYVFLSVKEMQNVQRDGINLYSNISVNFTDAILGTVIQVNVLSRLYMVLNYIARFYRSICSKPFSKVLNNIEFHIISWPDKTFNQIKDFCRTIYFNFCIRV